MKATPQVLKGMRDFLPKRMILRQYVMDQLRDVFEHFGFEPVQTPAVEYAETLEGKFGEEADKLIYKFEDRGGRSVGLRYDLTVPLARIVAMYPEVVKPFKRYQMAPVWRAERPQKGRYREFYQCDVDIIGSSSMLADAEVVTIAYQCLSRLKFTAFRILINNRKILRAVASRAGVVEEQAAAVWRAIDKWDKIGPSGVRAELVDAAVPEATIGSLYQLLDVRGDASEVLASIRANLAGDPVGEEGIRELNEIVAYLTQAGVPSRFFQVDLHMVRGLEYYTGPIFEIVVDEPKIGSLSGGGRYDGLIGLLGAQDTPAVGISLGLERLIDVIDDLGMAPATIRATVTEVLVTVFGPENRVDSLAIAASLRDSGVKAEVYLASDKLAAQMRYASRKGIPFAVIVGPDEAQGRVAMLRDMSTGTQELVEQAKLIEAVKTGMSHLTASRET